MGILGSTKNYFFIFIKKDWEFPVIIRKPFGKKLNLAKVMNFWKWRILSSQKRTSGHFFSKIDFSLSIGAQIMRLDNILRFWPKIFISSHCAMACKNLWECKSSFDLPLFIPLRLRITRLCDKPKIIRYLLLEDLNMYIFWINMKHKKGISFNCNWSSDMNY